MHNNYLVSFSFTLVKAPVMAFMLLITPCVSQADEWTGQDKALHFGAGLVIASVVSIAAENEATGFWTAVAVGASKELWDSKQPDHEASFKDFAWSAVGAYLGARWGAWSLSRTNKTTVVGFIHQF